MNALRISLLAPADLPSVLAFERENRRWFEAWVPPRPPEYFEEEGLRRVLNSLVNEQGAGTGRFYLVWSEGRLVARVNLIKRGGAAAVSARLGYRVAAEATGKGVATRAVKLVLADAFSVWELEEVEASTILGNVASERVLERNGFELARRIAGGLELKGRPVDRLDYVLRRER